MYSNPERRSSVKIVCSVHQLHLSFCEVLLILDSKLRLPDYHPPAKKKKKKKSVTYLEQDSRKIKPAESNTGENVLPGSPIESRDLETLQMPLARSRKAGKSVNLMEPLFLHL